MLQFLPRNFQVVIVSATAPSRATFRPGQSVPVSGIYRVTHGDAHRAAHELTLKKGEVFPPCRRCGQQVRFRLSLKGENKAHAQP